MSTPILVRRNRLRPPLSPPHDDPGSHRFGKISSKHRSPSNVLAMFSTPPQEFRPPTNSARHRPRASSNSGTSRSATNPARPMRKVQGLFVAKGNKVEAGQGVVALDDSGLRAEGLSLAASLASLRAEAAHRTAAIAAARAKDFKPPRCRLAARCARKYSRARAAGPCRGSCFIAVLNREPCRTAAAKAGRAHAACQHDRVPRRTFED